MIENGGHGGTAAAPAAARVFAHFFHVKVTQDRVHPLRLMLEYAGSQRTGLRAEREGIGLLHVVRSLDWLLLAGVAGLVGIGLWGIAGVTKFDVPGNPSYYLDKQMLYAAAGGARPARGGAASTRTSTGATGASSSGAPSG